MNEQRSTSRLVNITQIVSNVGVIISLIFVGLQVRQNTRVERLANQRETTFLDNSLWDLILNSPDIPRIVLQADSDISKLTREERMKYDSFAARRFNIYSLTHAQYEAGLLDPQVYAATERGLVFSLGHFRGSRIFWDENRMNYPIRFVTYVDSIIASLKQN